MFEDIEQVSLGHPLFEQGFQGFEVFGNRLSFQAFKVGRSHFINGQLRVVRKGAINAFGHLLQALLEMGDEGLGGVGNLQRLTIGGQTA
jgi:hypothetical protein